MEFTLEEHIAYQRYLRGKRKKLVSELKEGPGTMSASNWRKKTEQLHKVRNEIKKPTFFFASKDFKERKGIEDYSLYKNWVVK